MGATWVLLGYGWCLVGHGWSRLGARSMSHIFQLVAASGVDVGCYRRLTPQTSKVVTDVTSNDPLTPFQ
ncbi:hypothetical protein PF007_g23026 [Phytophthora fragariae]|uniref:Secreted protein n=1 Tax=Phytophthora fragariae TaxID=53985 RepID=A0A6A3QRT1_9STRA|nr:hypothetical protein PF003_g36410 [Phytophthora fragariae]KAE9080505.1 hypothetical protein PF007_g23026 [Phytophthora fragariae]KAE9169285.1 hypothetical protein PF004_g28228 [Phytophthora fragariae]